MREIDDISTEELKEVLGKSWLTHDGTWFLSVFNEYGIEAASRLNLAAITALAPVEVGRMKRLLEVDDGELRDFRSLMEFMRKALFLTMPSSIMTRADFSSEVENVFSWEFEENQCFAYRGMKMLGVESGYDCGVMFRISCWLDALGVKHEAVPPLGACRMFEGGGCAGEFRLYFETT
jgi:hypothetical protein